MCAPTALKNFSARIAAEYTAKSFPFFSERGAFYMFFFSAARWSALFSPHSAGNKFGFLLCMLFVFSYIFLLIRPFRRENIYARFCVFSLIFEANLMILWSYKLPFIYFSYNITLHFLTKQDILLPFSSNFPLPACWISQDVYRGRGVKWRRALCMLIAYCFTIQWF